jgi:hypothetical protein
MSKGFEDSELAKNKGNYIVAYLLKARTVGSGLKW